MKGGNQVLNNEQRIAEENDAQTKRLLKFLLDPTKQEIMNVVEDDTFVYFDTTDVGQLLMLKTFEFEVAYQDCNDHYHARVLKPNWFSKGL